MGKRIRAQKIGISKRRGPPSHRFKGAARHVPLKESRNDLVKGNVLDIIHDPGRDAPLAKVRFESGKTLMMIAPNHLMVGGTVSYGTGAELKEGSSMYLSDFPEGSLVYNVEANPGDGGKFGRTAGTSVRIVSHDTSATVVQLPSGRFKNLNPKCRASYGVVAGGGRHEKPFVKAGARWHAMKARGKIYPRVSGLNMNPCDHPFGGGGHPHIGKPKTVKRSAPPGRKVGSIAAKRKGRKR